MTDAVQVMVTRESTWRLFKHVPTPCIIVQKSVLFFFFFFLNGAQDWGYVLLYGTS